LRSGDPDRPSDNRQAIPLQPLICSIDWAAFRQAVNSALIVCIWALWLKKSVIRHNGVFSAITDQRRKSFGQFSLRQSAPSRFRIVPTKKQAGEFFTEYALPAVPFSALANILKSGYDHHQFPSQKVFFVETQSFGFPEGPARSRHLPRPDCCLPSQINIQIKECECFPGLWIHVKLKSFFQNFCAPLFFFRFPQPSQFQVPGRNS